MQGGDFSSAERAGILKAEAARSCSTFEGACVFVCVCNGV